MSDVPDEAREAALLALATKFALIESPVNLVVDAVLDAAAPHIRAAERQRLHDRIEALVPALTSTAAPGDTDALLWRSEVQAALEASASSPVSDVVGATTGGTNE